MDAENERITWVPATKVPTPLIREYEQDETDIEVKI